jgi:hypothetical protein
VIFSRHRRRRSPNLATFAALGVAAQMPKTPEESAAFQAACRKIRDDARRRIKRVEELNRRDREVFIAILWTTIVGACVLFLLWCGGLPPLRRGTSSILVRYVG